MNKKYWSSLEGDTTILIARTGPTARDFSTTVWISGLLLLIALLAEMFRP